jgi:hypothetical protein
MRLLGTTLVLLSLCGTATARKDPTARYIDEAHKAFEIGRYGEAIKAFEKAYSARRDPRLLYNLALSYYKRFELKNERTDLVQARDLFQRFLALVSPSSAKTRSERGKLIKVRRLAKEYLAAIEDESKRQGSPQSRPASQPTSAPTQQPARPAGLDPHGAPSTRGRSRERAQRPGFPLGALRGGRRGADGGGHHRRPGVARGERGQRPRGGG